MRTQRHDQRRTSGGLPARRVRQRLLRSGVLLLLSLGGAPVASADVVAAVDAARRASCPGRGVAHPLHETGALDGAARALARGSSLHAALATLPLRPTFATAIHLLDVRDDHGITRALASRYCDEIGNPGLREIGAAWSGNQLFIIVAVPLAVPGPGERATVEREVLERVNAARAAPRRCGDRSLPAVPPLHASATLSKVAAAHSAQMAASGELEHRDQDGSTPGDRVRRAGYEARVVGENVASGVTSAAEAVAGWLASPGHCANIMDARFTEAGLGYVVAPHTTGAIYWTQLLAAPRT